MAKNPGSTFQLTTGVDNIVGTDGDDIIKTTGGQLDPTDSINGGLGSDTLTVTAATVTLTTAQLSALTSVEQIDVKAAVTSVNLFIDAHAVQQTDKDVLTILGGTNAITIDTSQVDGAGRVIVSTTGLITLRDFDGQQISLGKGVDCHIQGGANSDSVTGGTGADTIDGGAGDDDLSGGNGGDTVLGGDGQDVVNGGKGKDLLDGGGGYDLITLSENDTATGGLGSDTFVIGSTTTNAVINDFDLADPLERIDLRAFSTVHGLGDLTITNAHGSAKITFGTSSILLTGVAFDALTAANFVFSGSKVVTAAQDLTTDVYASITANIDNIVGTSKSDVIQITGDISKFTPTDNIDGGLGQDFLRFVRDADTFDAPQFYGLHSIEVLDMTMASTISLRIDATNVTQADNHTLTILGGDANMLLDTKDVAGAGTVVVATFGEVDLRNFAGQAVTVDNSVNGHVVGNTFDDIITGGTGNDLLVGAGGRDSINAGSGDDSVDGGTGNDVLIGGAGNDRMTGGDGRDVITDGAGNDVISGDAGYDTISGGNGDDTLTGGANADLFVIDNSTGTVTITDFDPHNLLERIDFRGVGLAHGLADLVMLQVGSDTKITVGTETVILKGVSVGDFSVNNFLFAGSSFPTTFHVAAGTSEDAIQALIEDAPDGSTIILDPGTFTFDHTLTIDRSNITFRGSGVGQTIIVSTISDANASSTIEINAPVGRQQIANITVNSAAGTNVITVDDASKIHVGDILYIAEPNDAAMFAAWGDTGITLPADYTTNPQLYWLRECLVKVTAVNGNTITLSNNLPYDFQGNYAFVQKDTPLTNVDVGGFTIQASSGTPDPFDFTNEHPAWSSISTITVDTVTNSTIHDIQILNSHSMGISFRRDYGVTADNLNIQGSWDKGEEGNGLGVNLNEVFASTFTNLTVMDMRHSVEFSPWSAEHYNTVQFDSTNRDVNFHGSPDSMNTVIVDRDVLSFAPGGESWIAVGPGVFPIHPKSTIDANTVVFGYLDAGAKNDIVHAWDQGGYINGEGGDDTIYGGAAADTLVPGQGNDTITGGGGRDLFVRGFGGNADVITDFQAGAGGDYLVLTGYGFTGFADLVLTASGSDTIVDLGQDGKVTIKNVAPGALTTANFQFAAGSGAPMAITLFGTPTYLLGSDGADTFTLPQSALSTAPIKLLGGAGDDAAKVTITSFGGQSSIFAATWHGVDILDLSASTALNITFDQHVFDQADDHTFTLKIKDTGSATINVGNPTAGGQLFIDGAGTINLVSTVGNTIYGTDRIGVHINGGGLSDHIFGGALGDVLGGGSGDDVITGGLGADSLTGGAGNDVFDFNSISDSPNATPDLITDLADANDKIDLSGIDANTGLAGDQAFQVVSSFNHRAGDLVLTFSTTTGVTTVQGDVNGDGVADFTINLTGDHHLFTGFVL